MSNLKEDFLEAEERTRELYDRQAQAYDHGADVLINERLVSFSFVSLVRELGLMKEKQLVIDAACGSGYFTRTLRKVFPVSTSILGVDLSQSMVDVARSHEQKEPLGIQYECANVTELGARFPEHADVVTAIYLLNYASSRTHLRAMLRGIYTALREGGSFLVLHPLVHRDPQEGADLARRLGFPWTWVPTVPGSRSICDFDKILLTKGTRTKDNDPSVSTVTLETYAVFVDMIEQCAREEGFSSFSRFSGRVGPQGSLPPPPSPETRFEDDLNECAQKVLCFLLLKK